MLGLRTALVLRGSYPLVAGFPARLAPVFRARALPGGFAALQVQREVRLTW